MVLRTEMLKLIYGPTGQALIHRAETSSAAIPSFNRNVPEYFFRRKIVETF